MGKQKRPGKLSAAAAPPKVARKALSGDRSKAAKRQGKQQKFREKLAAVAPQMAKLANQGRGRVAVDPRKRQRASFSVLALSSALDDSAGGLGEGRSSAGEKPRKSAAVSNQHNIRKSKAKKKAMASEMLQMSAVVAHPAFQSGGISTIREHLLNTVGNKSSSSSSSSSNNNPSTGKPRK